MQKQYTAFFADINDPDNSIRTSILLDSLEEAKSVALGYDDAYMGTNGTLDSTFSGVLAENAELLAQVDDNELLATFEGIIALMAISLMFGKELPTTEAGLPYVRT